MRRYSANSLLNSATTSACNRPCLLSTLACLASWLILFPDLPSSAPIASSATSSSAVLTFVDAVPPCNTLLRMSSMRFRPDAFWISSNLLNSSSVSLALIRRDRLPVSMGGLPAFRWALLMVYNGLYPLSERKTKLRRFFLLCPRLPQRGAAGQRQGGFRGTRKHNLQLTKQGGPLWVFWLLTGVSACGRVSGCV